MCVSIYSRCSLLIASLMASDMLLLAMAHPYYSGCAATAAKEHAVVIEPGIHACAGNWTGHIQQATCNLCSAGWHVCSWRDTAVLKQLSLSHSRSVDGCYAFNAANENGTCGPCVDKERGAVLRQTSSLAMAGYGSDCPFDSTHEASCFGNDRIDATHQDVAEDGTAARQACHYQNHINGVLCCVDRLTPEERTSSIDHKANPSKALEEETHGEDGRVESVLLPLEWPDLYSSCPSGYMVMVSTNWTCPTNSIAQTDRSRSIIEVLCKDIDECAAGIAACAQSAGCINMPGSYRCECRAGFIGDPLSFCQDVDECSENSHSCGDGSTCRNTPGSYRCMCNGQEAQRFETCTALSALCSNGLACFNRGLCDESTKMCRCRQGYTGDQCQIYLCSRRCANGSRCVSKDKCRCRAGWTGQYCTEGICRKPCMNGGRCIAPRKCRCRSRYAGSQCEIRIFPYKL